MRNSKKITFEVEVTTREIWRFLEKRLTALDLWVSAVRKASSDVSEPHLGVVPQTAALLGWDGL
jgi:hypothetical protein